MDMNTLRTASLRRLAATAIIGVLGITTANGVAGATPGAVVADRPGQTLRSPDDEGSGTLRFGYHQALSSGFDPHLAMVSQDTGWLAPVYEPLILERPNGELAPGLATSWEFTDDNTALLLHLRDGVVFHDGATLDAEVVKANLDRAATIEGSAVVSMLAPVESVEVVDPMTVRLSLNQPAATLPRVLADRPGMIISPDSLDDPDLAANPVGAGMYRLVDWRPGDRAVYERFDGYWDPEQNPLASLEVILMADSPTRLNALRSGQIDAALLDPLEFIEADGAGLVTEEFDTTSVYMVQFNRTKSEFGDVRVRQAMNYAVDRASLAEAIFFSLATPSAQYYPAAASVGHVDGLDDRYPYSPDDARRLLDEAGLPDGFDFEMIVPNSPLFQLIGQALQAQYAEVGITMNIRTLDTGTIGQAFYVDEESDAQIGLSPGRSDPAMIGQIFFTDILSNPGSQLIDSVTAAYDASMIPAPEAERAVVLDDLMTATVEEAGQVVLVQIRGLVGSTDAVTGFNWSIAGKPDFHGTAMTDG
ncbi:MAG: ABC transporter substrate-binding protein [Desertimonas sp.]